MELDVNVKPDNPRTHYNALLKDKR